MKFIVVPKGTSQDGGVKRKTGRKFLKTAGPLLFLAMLLPAARGTEYFAGTSGNDGSSGLDPQNSFRTIQHAADVARGGDTVTVLDGVYHESVRIDHSGEAGAPITIRSQSHWGAKLIAMGNPANCFTIGGTDALGVAYIAIEGFDLEAPGTYGCGVESTHRAHHLAVEGNYAHDCGSSGIQLNDGDYRIVRNNVCARNALLMPYCGSGISLYGLIKADDAFGIHSIVSGNVCYANDNGPATRMTDGNGIIIDDFRDTQPYHTTSPAANVHYTGADTMVEGNLTFNNGGKGIQVFLSNQVTVANNTSMRNLSRNDHGTERGEISTSCADAVVVANNISVTTTSPASNPSNVNNGCYLAISNPKGGEGYAGRIVFLNNLSFDANQPGAPCFKTIDFPGEFTGADGNLPGLDPKLRNADAANLWSRDLPGDTDFASYFGLAKGSPAAGAGRRIEGASFSDRPVVNLGAFRE